MKSTFVITFAAMIVGLSAPLLFASPKQDAPSLQTSINPSFAPDLYAQLRKTEGNVFFSPYSITEALGMAHMGAKGETAKEIWSAMGCNFEDELFYAKRMSMRGDVLKGANQGDDKLSIANALCVTGRDPEIVYLAQVRAQYEAEIFHGGLKKINSWVKKKTDGKIDKILESLSPNSACVLLNAVYFKGTWAASFDSSYTRERDFHLTAQKSVKVPMMFRDGPYAFTRNDQYIAVELPYMTSCSMVLMMPAKAEDFGEFEAGVNEALINQISKQLKSGKGEIQLSVPKFKIETQYDLVPAMKQLGMVKAFDTTTADFGLMYDPAKLKIGNNIYISQIQHKATLEVDEEGSVAAAATGIELPEGAAIMPAETKIAFDRPFLVMIRENTTNSTLFMGRISDPTK